MSCRTTRWITLPLVLALLLLSGARAYASDFSIHYDLALALYQAQKFDAAIPEFQAAYDIDPKPGLLFSIAQSYRKAGRPREAIQYYDRYLATDSHIDSETRRKVDGYLTEARNTLATLELEMKQRLAEEKASREPDPPALAPVPVAPAPQPLVAPQPAPQPETKPVYKRWWFWTAIGGAVIAGVVVGTAVGVSQANASVSVPSTASRGVITF